MGQMREFQMSVGVDERGQQYRIRMINNPDIGKVTLYIAEAADSRYPARPDSHCAISYGSMGNGKHPGRTMENRRLHNRYGAGV